LLAGDIEGDPVEVLDGILAAATDGVME